MQSAVTAIVADYDHTLGQRNNSEKKLETLINNACSWFIMGILIQEAEYSQLKKKAAIADDALIQLEMSLKDLEEGRVHQL